MRGLEGGGDGVLIKKIRQYGSPVVGSNASDVGGASTGGKGSWMMVEGNGEIRFVPLNNRLFNTGDQMIEIQQQSQNLVSSWVGVCRDGGLEEGFKKDVGGRVMEVI